MPRYHFTISDEPPVKGDIAVLCGKVLHGADLVFAWNGNIRDRSIADMIDENSLRSCRKCIEAAHSGKREGKYLAGVVVGSLEEAA